MATRVYQYGLRTPTLRGDVVRAQMLAAHRYRNTLVEIERGRRIAVRSVISAHGDIGVLEKAVADANVELEKALRVVRLERARTKSRSESPVQKQAVKDAREVRRVATSALRDARRALKEDGTIQVKKDQIEELAAGLRRNARAHCGAYWGSYLLIEDADNASRKMPLYDGAGPNDPRFMRFMGEGRVGVQLQGGLPAADAFTETDTRMQIGRQDKRPTKRKDFRVLRLRVGTLDTGREPMWAEWPMLMHRPLPATAVIKWAVVSLRKIGPRECWTVQITATVPDAVPTAKMGMVAIDVGWRQLPEGTLRVAAWEDDAGQKGELVLTERAIGGIRKPEELRRLRDKKLDEIKKSFSEWLASQGSKVPAWLSKASENLVQWRSAARLTSLVYRWRDNRFMGDLEGYDMVEAWRYKDHHLWSWETSQRTGALRHRREVYRVFASKLVREYGTVVIENFNKSAVARLPLPEDSPDNMTARSNRQLAAVSELCLTIKNACGREGVRLIEENPAFTTKTCNVCGLVSNFDAEANVSHGCDGCGSVWDQDANAAINLLERAKARIAAEGAKPPASDGRSETESRWVKAKRMSAEKTLRKKSMKTDRAATIG